MLLPATAFKTSNHCLNIVKDCSILLRNGACSNPDYWDFFNLIFCTMSISFVKCTKNLVRLCKFLFPFFCSSLLVPQPLLRSASARLCPRPSPSFSALVLHPLPSSFKLCPLPSSFKLCPRPSAFCLLPCPSPLFPTVLVPTLVFPTLPFANTL
jgi:hypothetical protein